jgi:hypothetical protein
VPNGGFDFFGSLGDALNAALLNIQFFFAAVIDFLYAVVSFLYQVIVQIILFLEKAFRVLIRAFKHVISDIVHGRFLHLYQDYLELKRKIKAWFEKHLPWLLELRKRFDLWYRRTIIPILNTIQRVRAILNVLKIFHVKFATKLDLLLGQLEAKIIRNTLALRGRLNQVISILDLVLDPGLLLRQNVLIASAARAIRGLMNTVGLGFGRALTSTEQAELDRDRDRYKVANVDAHVAQLAATGATADDLLMQQQGLDALSQITGVNQGTVT